MFYCYKLKKDSDLVLVILDKITGSQGLGIEMMISSKTSQAPEFCSNKRQQPDKARPKHNKAQVSSPFISCHYDAT